MCSKILRIESWSFIVFFCEAIDINQHKKSSWRHVLKSQKAQFQQNCSKGCPKSEKSISSTSDLTSSTFYCKVSTSVFYCSFGTASMAASIASMLPCFLIIFWWWLLHCREFLLLMCLLSLQWIFFFFFSSKGKSNKARFFLRNWMYLWFSWVVQVYPFPRLALFDCEFAVFEVNVVEESRLERTW